MKSFGTLFTILSLSSVWAQSPDWTIQKCSNSDGSVIWESNHDQNEIRLKYANFVEGILYLKLDEVKINYLETKTLDDQTSKNCTKEHKRKVVASKILITPAQRFPNVLRSHFPDNMISTEVICTEVSARSSSCKRK